jgi:hypothetical protein
MQGIIPDWLARRAERWYANLTPMERYQIELDRQRNEEQVREEFKLRAKVVTVILALNALLYACPDVAWF